jgi:dihydrofolate reductase
MLSLIAALDRQRLIGAGGALPWRLPEDLRRFKALTLGKPVLMGRKTWDSLGRPLPGRRNLVITRQPGWQAAGADAAASLEAALTMCTDAPEIMVIGGAEIYRLALPLAQRLYLTEIDAVFTGDAWFPELERTRWRESARATQFTAGPPPLAYAFVQYDRMEADAENLS